jgi:N6-adenosine-specific RNA methylase IME4
MGAKIYTKAEREQMERKGHAEQKHGALVPAQPTGQLLSVEKARQMLVQSRSVDEVRDVADKSKAVALYLRTKNASLESQNDAAEIHLRAIRRLGELVAEMPKAKGAIGTAGPGRGKRGTDERPRLAQPPTLAEQGIKKQDAAKWQQLAKIPDKKFEKLVSETREKGGRLTAAAPLKLLRNDAKADLAAELRAKPVPLASGRFNVIVSDPPWAYEKRAGDVTHRADLPYPSMQIDEICALPVADRAEENCVLWLWTTNAFMRDAFKVIDAWGFQEKTILTWAKDRMGTGDWLRGKTEHCIMAVRGKPIVQLTNETTLLEGPLREHSRKPDEFYALVEKLCPGTKLEMFCREARTGWAKWGAETEKFGG